MKILKVLKEQEQTIDGGIFGYTVDTLDKIEKSFEASGSFEYSHVTINNPNGKYKFIPTLTVKRTSEVELRLTMKMYLVINVWEIPNDFLIFVAEWLTGKLKKNIPNLEEMLNDSRLHKGAINFGFEEIFISKGDVFFRLDDYMDTMYYNSRIRRVHPLEDLMNPQTITQQYSIDPSQVPTFSDGFSLATDQINKKVRHVYQGFRKGTYKGHQYEYKEDKPRISILLEKENFDPNTKVLHPKFRVQINAGYVQIDGKPTGGFFYDKTEMFEDKEFIKEFDLYIKQRFEQFGIKII